MPLQELMTLLEGVHMPCDFEVRQGDKWNNESHRAEYRDYFRARMGKEYWYGISMFIPQDFPEHKNRNVVLQWHASPDLRLGEVTRSPVLAFRFQNGNMKITLRHSTERIQKSNNGINKLIHEMNNFTKGIWNDFIINTKWSYKG